MESPLDSVLLEAPPIDLARREKNRRPFQFCSSKTRFTGVSLQCLDQTTISPKTLGEGDLPMQGPLYTVQELPSGKVNTMARPRGGDWLFDEIKPLRASGVDIMVSLLTS